MIARITRIPFWFSVLAVAAIIFDLGFDQSPFVQNSLYWIYIVNLCIGVLSLAGRYVLARDRPRRLAWFIDILLLLVLVMLLMHFFHIFHVELLNSREWFYVASFVVFFRELFALNIDFSKRYFNPAQLFVLSFFSVIMLGTLLLILPKATYEGISVIDALFTSTSAVCVTGLIVVDTGSYFTPFGQHVILALIQVGGIGIMTITSYFSYFFRGSSSYENQLLLKDISNSEKITEVFGTLKKIILLTFLTEAVGAIIIYSSLDPKLFANTADRIFFAAFHAISAFCNAGFSTLRNGFYETGFRFNYPLHLVVATLIIIGGIGYPIMLNFYKYIKHLVLNRLLPASRKQQALHLPWVININTRIVVITTTCLIVFGTVLFYLFEYNNTLAEHHGFGKLVTAFFGAVTPRTAGFNSVDVTALNFSTIMIIFLLMWIGASPGSTGGGIKTTTFAIGTLNFLSLAKGKDRIEVYRREVADLSVRRAFATISLSLVVIGLAVFLIATFDSDKGLLPIAFECFSAYSTVGLSLGITDDLSSASKMVIILTMFVGRVSVLTILIAMFRQVKFLKYRYPTEDILIN